MATAVLTPTHELDELMHKPLAELVREPHLPLLRLDLSVTADPRQMPKESITFTLTLSPGILDVMQPDRQIDVPVLVLDRFGNIVSKRYSLSTKGQVIADTVQVPIADPTIFKGMTDPGREIQVLIDPFHTIVDRTDRNNWATAWCYTIG